MTSFTGRCYECASERHLRSRLRVHQLIGEAGLKLFGILAVNKVTINVFMLGSNHVYLFMELAQSCLNTMPNFMNVSNACAQETREKPLHRTKLGFVLFLSQR